MAGEERKGGEVFAVSARSNRLYLLNNMLRESLALAKDKIAGNL